MNVIGISINGSILEVNRDRVKVNLEISNNLNKSEAYWFIYATSCSMTNWRRMVLYARSRRKNKARLLVIHIKGRVSASQSLNDIKR